MITLATISFSIVAVWAGSFLMSKEGRERNEFGRGKSLAKQLNSSRLIKNSMWVF